MSSETTGGAKARNWSITINNPTAEDYAQIEQLKAKSWCKGWDGQLEKGDNGTPHIQAALKTDSVKFSMVKRVLARAHIEPARNAVALRQYVHKEETRVATMPSIRAASLGDIQRELLTVVQSHLSHKGQWFEHVPSGKKFVKKYIETDDDFEMVLRKNAWYIHETKAAMFDESINNLIRQGYYGAEMYGANNLTRSSILKYFESIVIRTHASQLSSCVPQGEESNICSNYSEEQASGSRLEEND